MYRYGRRCSVLANKSRTGIYLRKRVSSHKELSFTSSRTEKRNHSHTKRIELHALSRTAIDDTLPLLSAWRHNVTANNHQATTASTRDDFQGCDLHTVASACSEALGISPHSLKYSSQSDHKYFTNDSFSPLSCYTSLLGSGHSGFEFLQPRSFHTTACFQKEESKVEKTVKALKDEQKKSESTSMTEPPPVPGVKPAIPSEVKDTETTPAAVALPKKTIWQRVKNEIVHLYHGFRLLFIDVKVCIRLLWSVLNGKNLTRRERNQLVRTTADMFRLVPFLVFVIVPFMEFLLPVAIKLFPNMLPSTFHEESTVQEKLRKKLKVKLEMAKFLQDTIEETAVQKKGARGEKVQEFAEFMNKIRSLGLGTNNKEIIKYSKLFEDEITLDNLTHPQLRALCNLLEVGTSVGTSNLLRFQIRMKLRQLEADDKMIMKEGVDCLAVWELQAACRARGMRALGVPEERLKSQLTQWLDLHLNEKIPTSLLLLSRALYLPETLSTGDQLKATISALSDTTVAAEEAKVKISELSGDRVDNRSKIEVIQQEEEIIRQEKEEREKEEKIEAEKAALVDDAKKADVEEDISEVVITPSIVDSAAEIKASPEEVLVDMAEVIEEKPAEVEEKAEEEISSQELETMEVLLEAVAKDQIDHHQLETLKTDVSEYKENIEDMKEVMVASGEELSESKSAKRLSKHVDRMIAQMDVVTTKLNRQKDVLLEDIEVKEVRIKRNPDLREDEDARQEVLELISEKKTQLVDINELLLAVKRLQKVENETRLQKVAEVLDADCDGKVDVEDAMKVIEHLGRENVKIKTDQMSEIMDILKKEELILIEEKEAKMKEKQEKKMKEASLASEIPAGGEYQSDTPTDTPTSEAPPTQDDSLKKESQKQ